MSIIRKFQFLFITAPLIFGSASVALANETNEKDESEAIENVEKTAVKKSEGFAFKYTPYFAANQVFFGSYFFGVDVQISQDFSVGPILVFWNETDTRVFLTEQKGAGYGFNFVYHPFSTNKDNRGWILGAWAVVLTYEIKDTFDFGSLGTSIDLQKGENKVLAVANVGYQWDWSLLSLSIKINFGNFSDLKLSNGSPTFARNQDVATGDIIVSKTF